MENKGNKKLNKYNSCWIGSSEAKGTPTLTAVFIKLNKWSIL